MEDLFSCLGKTHSVSLTPLLLSYASQHQKLLALLPKYAHARPFLTPACPTWTHHHHCSPTEEMEMAPNWTCLPIPSLPWFYLPLVSIALGWGHLSENKRQNAWRMKQDFHMAGPLHYPNLSFCFPWNSLCWGFTGLPSAPTTEFSSVQSLSHVWLSATPWTSAGQASLSSTNSWRLLKLMSIMSMMPSNHLIICHRLLLLLLQSFPQSVSFPVSQLFTSGGQSTGVSASASGFQWILRTDFLWNGLVESPCSPRNSGAQLSL